jgi:CheY-like chemotaxis protein
VFGVTIHEGVMAQLLLVDEDPGTLLGLGGILRAAGYRVITASSGMQAVERLGRHRVDLVLADLHLPDMSGLEFLQYVRRTRRTLPFVVVTGFASTHDAVTAMRLGAADVLEKPVRDESLLRAVQAALRAAPGTPDAGGPVSENVSPQEAHAAARWARALVPVIDAPKDPRTITGWSQLAFVSPGALRTWCRMAGVSPRRSLVFARLLRAVCLGQGGRHKPENLLDVVDRRTLVGLLKLAGLSPDADFPRDIDTFLQGQTLVRDPDTLREIKRAIAAGRRQAGSFAERRDEHCPA